jgi:GTPase SAR1 family protein
MTNSKDDRDIYRVVIVGNSFVGKSCLSRRFVMNMFQTNSKTRNKYLGKLYQQFPFAFFNLPIFKGKDPDRTIEDSYAKTISVKQNMFRRKDYHFFIRDFDGRERNFPIMDVDAFLVVYSITDPDSLAAVLEIVNIIKRRVKGRKTPIFMVGNKVTSHYFIRPWSFSP